MLTVADLRRAARDDPFSGPDASLEADHVSKGDAKLHRASAGEELVAALLHHEDAERARFIGRADNGTQREDRYGLGVAYGNVIGLERGLKPGDRVITSGATQVRDGQQVRVLP